jgi:PAS domain S-box-containing protein
MLVPMVGDSLLEQEKNESSSQSVDDARLRSLLQNVAAIVWTVDAELRPVFIAGDMALITGYSEEEIRSEDSGAVWARAVHPDDLDRVIATHAGIFRTREPFDIEYRYRRKEGVWVWLNDRASHVYERGGVQYVDGVTYDITQRKREERQQIAAAEFGRRAVQAHEVRALLEDACNTMCGALDADSCTALWRERDADHFTFAAVAGVPVPLPSKVADDVSILAGYAYRSEHGITYEDLRTETRFHAPALIAGGVRSGISAPLRGREVRYGVISAHCMERRRFSDRECAFVETIANVASDAIERIEAERALATIAERYAQIVESADQGICAVEQGRIVFANSAVARMTGIAVPELIGRTFAELAAPRDRERVEAFVDAPAGDEPSKLEVELAPTTGGALWAILTGSRLRAADSTLVLITDITDRVRAENDLRRRQAQLADAQALAHIGSFDQNLTTGAIEWSDELYRIVGLEPQSRIIDTALIASLMAPELAPRYGAGMQTLAAGGMLDLEHPFLRVDGTRRMIHTRAQGTTDPATGEIRSVGIMQDITAQYDAQQAIAEREARLQLIVSRLPVIIWSTDARLHLSSVIGAGFSAMTETHFEELHLTVPDLIGPPPVEGSIADALEGRPVSYDTWHGTRELRVHIEPLRDRTGAISGTVGIAFDRTEQLRTERVLSSIAQSAITKIGDDFFRTAVVSLASVLHVDYAFIAQIDEGGVLRSVAAARDGQIAGNFESEIAGTPCEPVVSGVPCWIEDRLAEAFPQDRLVDELQAVSFAGVPIVDAAGLTIGLVAVVHRQPLKRNAAAEAALQIYADRAAVELDRMQYERSLVDEKEYVENLIDTANVVIIEVDADGAIRLVNRAFELLTGHSRTEVEGQQLLDIVSDASPAEHVITSGSHEMEATIAGHDGERRLLRFRANDVRRAGRAVGTILFGTDITEARRAEQQQQKLQEQIVNAAAEWRQTFDSVLTPIFLVDGAGRVARVNRAARRLSRLPYPGIIGTRLDTLSDGEPFATAARLLADAGVSGEALETAEARDSSDRTWAINVMPFASPDQPASSIVVLWDISRIVALQESVRLSEQMSVMGQLVAGVAHEVRNPLFGISAALDAFEEEFGRTEEFREYIVRLRTDADRLHRLMNELLEYGRPAELQRVRQPFATVVERSVRACAPVARQKHVTIETRADEHLPDAAIDRDRVVQVLKNVIENAIAFTASGSTVTVDVREDVAAQQIVSTVSDSGPGFREDDLPHVFTPFFTRRRGGTGLGLAIVRRIVDDHGGSVFVRNGDEGGAVVEIRLPIDFDPRVHDAPQ